MRQSNRFLGSVLALGVVAALSLGPVSRAGEAKQAARSTAAKVHQKAKAAPKAYVLTAAQHTPAEYLSYNFVKVESHFNPKELTIDKSVPWQKDGSRN